MLPCHTEIASSAVRRVLRCSRYHQRNDGRLYTTAANRKVTRRRPAGRRPSNIDLKTSFWVSPFRNRHEYCITNNRQWKAFFSTSAETPGEKPESGKREKNPSYEINGLILDMGKQKRWQSIIFLHRRRRKDFDNINYATAMSQLGRIRFIPPYDALLNGFVLDLAAELEEKGLSWMGTRQIAIIMHAMGKIGLKTPAAKRIAAFVSKDGYAQFCVQEGNPQSVANTAWTFGKLQLQSPHFFSEIEERAEWFVKEGNTQNIANTAWACGRLKIQSPKFFAEIDKRAEWFVQEGNPQALATTAWACGRLDIQSPQLFSEIDKRSGLFVQEGNPQNIANTAWACGKLNIRSPRLFSKIGKCSEWFVREGMEEAEFRGLETLAIYYEDFGLSQGKMVGGIADFLGMPQNSKKRKEVPQFLRARMYDDYYTDEQRRAIWRLIETIAMPKTLELLQRYRDG